MIPESYDQWVHCITVRCGIQLTEQYASGRLRELRDQQHPRTKEFRRIYGDDYWQRVISWFEQNLSGRAQ